MNRKNLNQYDFDCLVEDSEKLKKIKKIAEKHHEERYDTDWNSMQEALMKIWKLTK